MFSSEFPQAKLMIEQYCSHNLQHLTVEAVNSYIIEEVIPKMYALWATEQETNDPGNLEGEAFKKSFRLTAMCLQTTLNWMHKLGMQYDSNKKTFYVDGH